MKTLAATLFACALSAAPLRIHYTAFAAGPDGKPDGWTTWSARAETAPRTFVDRIHFRDKPGSLAISGNSNVAAHGTTDNGICREPGLFRIPPRQRAP